MIFIDTGAFVARYRTSDSFHDLAVAGWKQLEAKPRRCFTSDLVLAETITLLRRYIGAKPAAERARIILSSAALTILRPEQEEELQAADWLEKYREHELSFTDCVSFALMRQYRIRTVMA